MNINEILKDYTELIQYSNFTLSDDKYIFLHIIYKNKLVYSQWGSNPRPHG